MSSAVADLETGLQAMLGLKPPGVSGSRITGITSLCVANVQVRIHSQYPSICPNVPTTDPHFDLV